MNKLTKSTFYAQFISPKKKNDKSDDNKKDESEKAKMRSKSPIQKKISISTPLNVFKIKEKEKKINEKSNTYLTPTKCTSKSKKEWNNHYYIDDINRCKELTKNLKPIIPIALYTPELHKKSEVNVKSKGNLSKFYANLSKSLKLIKSKSSPEIVDIESEEETLFPSPLQNKGLPILSFRNALLTEYDLNLIKNGWLNDANIDFFALYSLFNISDTKRIDKYYIFPSFLSLYLFKSIEKVDKLWFKDLNLKKVKFLIFPINLDMHWSLAVIVNSNKYYKKYKNPQYEYKENTQPFIMLMGSMGIHSISVIQEKIKKLYCQLYNQEEDKKIMYEPIEIKYKRLELPRQENARDCGVFVLFYLFYFLQSQDIIEYNNVKEWSKKCNFPINSIFMRSYLMYLVHEIYLKKNKEKQDEYYKRNKKIINSLHDRNYLISQNSLLLKLHDTCPLLPMNGLIKQNLILIKDVEIEKNESNKEKEEDNIEPSVMDILDGKTLNKPVKTNAKCLKRKLNNNIPENEEGTVKKMYKILTDKVKSVFYNPKHDKTNNAMIRPIIPTNPATNIKKIIPKHIEAFYDSDDLNDLPPVISLHDDEENKKVKNKKKNKSITSCNVEVGEKDDCITKKRKKENEEKLKKKKQKTLQSNISFSEKTKNELDNVKTPTKKK